MWSLIRRDIGEFVSTVKDDAAKTLKSAMSLGEEGEEDYDSYYDSESDDYEEDYDEGPEGGGDGGDKWRDGKTSRGRQRASAALRAMRSDMKTYSEGIPEADAARFHAFTKCFDVGAKTQEIATLLKEDPVVTKIHTQLVPQHVSYDDFWSRYFFRAERLAQREVGGGRSFPRHDEEEDEEFAWGDDDQDDEGHDRQNKTDAPTADAAPAGGALGAMDVAHQDAATTPRRRHSEGSALLSVPGGPAGKDRSSEGEVAVATGDAVASAEIARLTEALASMSGKAEKMTRERDAALAEAVQLKARVCQSEKDLEQAAARVAELIDAAAAARRDSDARLGKIQDALDASEARAAAAEKEAEESFASRKETMAAARVAAGSDGNENAVAMAAEAEAAVKELSRLKKALREERSQHEEILLASRQAANEAVEAALSSADADREEACAEATASMRAENERKAEELDALRAQLTKSAAAMEEIGTLKADVDELRRAVEIERETAFKAAGEAKQEGEAAKQLREEVRALRAAADQARAMVKGSAGGLMKRGTNRTDVAGEDTDGWGDDEYDSCCAASNSSGVVVDRPPSLASPDADNGRGRPGNRQKGGVTAAALAGDDRSGGSDVGGRVAPGSARQAERTGRKEGGGEGEGDDGWEGWD